MFICVVYAPVSNDTAKEIDSFYSSLSDSVNKLKLDGNIVLMGDLNSRCGCSSGTDDHIGQFGETKVNTNGRKLIQFLKKNDLYTMNGRYKENCNFTRIRGEKKSIIDYIIVDNDLFSKTDKSTFKVLTENSIESDHKPIILDLQLNSELYLKKKYVQRNYCVNKLNNPFIKYAYQDALSIALEQWEKWFDLNHINGRVENHKELIENAWRKLDDAIQTAAKSTLGIRNDGFHGKPWWNQDVKNCINNKRKLYIQLQTNPNVLNEYLDSLKEVKQAICKAKRDAW